jgi:hypothetical protein
MESCGLHGFGSGHGKLESSCEPCNELSGKKTVKSSTGFKTDGFRQGIASVIWVL